MIVNPAIEEYCTEHSSPVGKLLHEIERFTRMKVQMPDMISGAYQGRVLSMISQLLQPKRILEIGTFTGYATLCLADGLNKDGLIYTIDKNEELEDDVRSFFEKSGLGSQIRYLIGNAPNIIPDIDEMFDLIFLDADKKNYSYYLSLIVPKLRKGGLLITDNVLWKTRVLSDKMDSDTAAIHNFNQLVLQHNELEVVILPVRDGLSLARKK